MKVLGVLVLFAAAGLPQTTGIITGNVRDVTGRMVAGTQITARNTGTGLTRKTETAGEGRFVLALPVGVYEIRAEKSGFRPSTQTGIRLTVAGTVTVEFQLRLGTLEQAITVEGSPPLVNTQTPELSYLVSEGAIEVLPLNGRNYTDLALLQPGVVDRKSTRLNSSHIQKSRMPSSA